MQTPLNDQVTQVRNSSLIAAIECFGYSYVLRRRANRFRFALNTLSVVGIAIPATIGGIVLTYGYNHEFAEEAGRLSAILLMVQGGLSSFSVVMRWDDSLSKSIDSSLHYAQLSHEFDKLRLRAPVYNSNQYQNDFDLLDREKNSRDVINMQSPLSDRSMRRGMRAALRQFHHPCAACNHTPTDMANTECGVCGNFKLNYKYISTWMSQVIK